MRPAPLPPTAVARRGARPGLAPALLALAIVVGRPLAAQSTAPASTALDTAAILAGARPEIEAANAAWLPGLRQRDARLITAAYADSGLFVAADGIVTRGRAAIAGMYAARFPGLRPIRAGAVVQDGLAVAGPTLVHEWGHAWLELEPERAGASPTRSGGSYLTVWRREGDGHWRIVRNLSF